MAKKFELTAEFVTNIFGKKLFRIKALMAFGDVKEGELGGYLEKEENLDHDGDAWVYGDARVYGNAWVSGDAQVPGDAQVYGNAWVSGDADYATIKGFGSKRRATTFFRLKSGEIGVRCGCFYGTLEQFREKVKETHRNSKYAKEYLMIADLMQLHFQHEEEKKCDG
uniref:Transferase, nesg, ydcK, Structural Genomics.38A n=1 Tax=Siphoviridae sp. ctmIh35 TaxID=2827932 RepID=A0A8S5T8K4_9CAUD|nr:MAG TPA: Putative transferase, nesg, ydcK, Structural Genomics.38A [Siphoviridae sp. ctmIh35]